MIQRMLASSLFAAAFAATLVLAGCAKKEVAVGPEEEKAQVTEQAGAATIEPETSGVEGAGVEAIGEPEHSVYFAFDSYTLDDAARTILDANVEWLRTHPELHLVIEGNCDERGTREYNLALGQRRADAVRDYLISQGIDPGRIDDTISYGEERPVCRGSGEACWAQNRRVDIVIR